MVSSASRQLSFASAPSRQPSLASATSDQLPPSQLNPSASPPSPVRQPSPSSSPTPLPLPSPAENEFQSLRARFPSPFADFQAAKQQQPDAQQVLPLSLRARFALPEEDEASPSDVPTAAPDRPVSPPSPTSDALHLRIAAHATAEAPNAASHKAAASFEVPYRPVTPEPPPYELPTRRNLRSKSRLSISSGPSWEFSPSELSPMGLPLPPVDSHPISSGSSATSSPASPPLSPGATQSRLPSFFRRTSPTEPARPLGPVAETVWMAGSGSPERHPNSGRSSPTTPPTGPARHASPGGSPGEDSESGSVSLRARFGGFRRGDSLDGQVRPSAQTHVQRLKHNRTASSLQKHSTRHSYFVQEVLLRQTTSESLLCSNLYCKCELGQLCKQLA